MALISIQICRPIITIFCNFGMAFLYTALECILRMLYLLQGCYADVAIEVPDGAADDYALSYFWSGYAAHIR